MNSNDFPSVTDPIDQITLDFLMNRHQYKKYVAKSDPTKHIENEEHLQKIWKYRNRISEFTDDLLKNPETMITLDVNQAFDRYVRTLIRYLEMKELEKNDIDIMFDDMDDDEDRYRTSVSEKNKLEIENKNRLLSRIDEEQRGSISDYDAQNEACVDKVPTKSYWGKETVKKTQTMADFFLNQRKHK